MAVGGRHTQTFTNIVDTVATDYLECSGFSRIVVTIDATEASDGLTITPEIQFNPSTDTSLKTWSTGAKMQFWHGAATATVMNLAMTAITATGTAHANVPVFGPLVRVNLAVTGTPGEFTPVTVMIMGVE